MRAIIALFYRAGKQKSQNIHCDFLLYLAAELVAVGVVLRVLMPVCVAAALVTGFCNRRR